MTPPAEHRPASAPSLQRRLLMHVVLAAPLAWVMALVLSYHAAQHEVDELYDTELIQLARQVQAAPGPVPRAAGEPLPQTDGDAGAADVDDIAIAVWDRDGRLARADRDGARLPYRAGAAGFAEVPLAGAPWRVYYLPSVDGRTLVATGQRMKERDEIVRDLVGSPLVPWLAMLPLLLAVLAWGVRRAFAPVRALADELHARGADDLQPVPARQAPAELQPLVGAMNGLFGRIDAALARERRFTADAAHELRTPLAVLRVQWDVVRRTTTPAERALAEAGLGAGLERLDRLVAQLLALARLDTGSADASTGGRQRLDWPTLVRDVVTDVLPLAERRHIDLECDLPQPPARAWPLEGNPALIAVLLRNLLDNAARYAPARSTVIVQLGPDRLVVRNPLTPAQLDDPAALARLGERFHRPDGQDEPGSGLGVSIAQRIAALHGLNLRYEVTTGVGGPRERSLEAVLKA